MYFVAPWQHVIPGLSLSNRGKYHQSSHLEIVYSHFTFGLEKRRWKVTTRIFMRFSIFKSVKMSSIPTYDKAENYPDEYLVYVKRVSAKNKIASYQLAQVHNLGRGKRRLEFVPSYPTQSRSQHPVGFGGNFLHSVEHVAQRKKYIFVPN